MQHIRIFALISLLFLSACGDDDTLGGNGSNGTGIQGTSGDDTITDNNGSQVNISSVTLISDKRQIPSDSSSNAELTALVKDHANNFVSGVNVEFSASNDGGITVTRSTTNDNGQATANLSTIGNKSNRIITASATVGSITDSLEVAVTGTEVVIQGPEAVGLGSSGEYSFSLRDSSGNGISGKTVNISSSLNNGLSASSGQTDINGEFTLQYTANNAGTDSLSGQALGAAAAQSISISQDVFTIQSANNEVTLNANTTVTANWQQNGMAVNGQAVNFSTTRGSLSAATANTDTNGDAAVNVSANNAGPAVITATTNSGLSAAVEIEFVATQASSINVQAEPAVIGPNGNANIVATVRDPDNNLVKGKQITFTLNDVTGGSLSSGTVTTNSQGRAVTSYQASSTASATDGVQITATVQDTPAVSDTAHVTVAGRQVTVTFGTNNQILTNGAANPTYQKPYLLQVIDINGRPVANTSVALSVIPPLPEDGIAYAKGGWRVAQTFDANGDPDGEEWQQFRNFFCFNEDLNRNGIFDNSSSSAPDNDVNNNGELEPGNHAIVVPGTVVTDDNGQANFTIDYPAEYGAWTRVEIRAELRVEGTEHRHTAFTWLEILASDIADVKVRPPGETSPFGTGSCSQAF